MTNKVWPWTTLALAIVVWLFIPLYGVFALVAWGVAFYIGRRRLHKAQAQ